MAQAKFKPQPTQAIRKPSQGQGRYPVPVGGLNYHQSLLTMPPTEALLLDNFVPRPYGLEIRKGWQFWIPEADKFVGEVRTIMPYTAAVTANSRIFAGQSADDVIYDVTTPNAAPTVSHTCSSHSTVKGEWYYLNFVTPGGAFLCCVSHGAGYLIYDTALGWREVAVGTAAGQLQFPAGDTTTPKDFTSIFVWKNRLWFLTGNSSTTYYLPVCQLTGQLSVLNLGSQLLHGGVLSFATSWTYDSGRGIDDSLVFVSSEGDILVYQGTDPANVDTFSLQGAWYAGRIVAGRRAFCALGGDVILLTEYGVIRMSDLVSGRLAQAELTSSSDTFYKINPRLARFVTNQLNDPYWFLLPYPSDELLILGSPYLNNVTGARQSFVMNSLINAWATLSDLDLLCADVYYGKMIYGTRDGYVIHGFVGFSDRVSSDSADVGTEVTGRLQSSFNDFGNPTMNKRLLRMKIYGVCDGIPSASIRFVNEYDLTTRLDTASPLSKEGGIWDGSNWDDAFWAGNQLSLRRWIGICGYGKKLSMLMAIRGQGQTILSDYEVLFETGANL